METRGEEERKREIRGFIERAIMKEVQVIAKVAQWAATRHGHILVEMEEHVG